MSVLLDLVYFLATPFVLLWLAVPSRFFTRKRYRSGLREKLGGVPRRQGDRPCLWLHAVSVGELRAALPLVEAFRSDFPLWDLWVSTSTDTGQDLAKRSLPEGIPAIYYPLDYGFAVRRALRRVRPRTVVLVELELWPNFLLAMAEEGIPVLVANGRISARSYSRYRRLRFISKFLFRCLKAVGAQNQEYAKRFEALGTPRERIEVLGNLKYDARPKRDNGSTRDTLGWTESPIDPVIMGGCTHPGEEQILLEIWSDLRRSMPNLKLILAPRHIERSGEVAALAASRGEVVLRWSAVPPPVDQAKLIPAGCKGSLANSLVIVDRIGELEKFYGISDVVFVGGSLTERGGHNILEPARLGRPVLFGPSISNFEEIARHLLDRQGAVQVKDASGLRSEIDGFLQDPQKAQTMGNRAREAAEELGGATARHLDWIRRNVM